jgi:predicted DNA-binding transcriptional regulator YafY
MAVAVVVGASAGAAIPGIERGALAALAKLDRLLPPRLQSQLASLRSATVSLTSPTDVVSTESLVRLAQACDGHQRATFCYRAHGGEDTERRVEPYRLVATDRRWYLVAFDLDRDDWRTFRVDRASSVVVTGHTFVPRPLSDPARTVADAITTTAYARRAVVLVRATTDEVARKIPAHVGVVEADGVNSRVVLGVDDFDWLAGYLVGLGLEFEALEPPELRDHLATVGARIVRSHGHAARLDPPSGFPAGRRG